MAVLVVVVVMVMGSIAMFMVVTSGATARGPTASAVSGRFIDGLGTRDGIASGAMLEVEEHRDRGVVKEEDQDQAVEGEFARLVVESLVEKEEIAPVVE